MKYYIGWQSKKNGLYHGVYIRVGYPTKESAERAITLLSSHSRFEYWVQDNPKVA